MQNPLSIFQAQAHDPDTPFTSLHLLGLDTIRLGYHLVCQNWGEGFLGYRKIRGFHSEVRELIKNKESWIINPNTQTAGELMEFHSRKVKPFDKIQTFITSCIQLPMGLILDQSLHWVCRDKDRSVATLLMELLWNLAMLHPVEGEYKTFNDYWTEGIHRHYQRSSTHLTQINTPHLPIYAEVIGKRVFTWGIERLNWYKEVHKVTTRTHLLLDTPDDWMLPIERQDPIGLYREIQKNIPYSGPSKVRLAHFDGAMSLKRVPKRFNYTHKGQAHEKNEKKES